MATVNASAAGSNTGLGWRTERSTLLWLTKECQTSHCNATSNWVLECDTDTARTGGSWSERLADDRSNCERCMVTCHTGLQAAWVMAHSGISMQLLQPCSAACSKMWKHCFQTAICHTPVIPTEYNCYARATRGTVEILTGVAFRGDVVTTGQTAQSVCFAYTGQLHLRSALLRTL